MQDGKSHFALDSIPHLDAHGLFGRPTGPTDAEMVAAAVDVLAGMALVIWATGRQSGGRLIYAAAFAGILMDVVFNLPPWGQWFGTWPGSAWLSLIHHVIQHNTPPAQWPLGFGTQAVIFAASIRILRRKEHPSPARKGD